MWLLFSLVMFTMIVGTHLPALLFLCKVKVKEVCVKAQHEVLFLFKYVCKCITFILIRQKNYLFLVLLGLLFCF